jgi:hypothetical protein
MKSLFCVVSLFAAAGILCAHAAGISSNEAVELARKTASQWTWGAPTNGIVGGIYVNSQPLKHTTEYWVYVHEEFKTSADSPPPTFYSEPNSNALPQGWFLKKFGDTNWAGTYFKATNYFCGPVALRNSDGVEVPTRNPNLVSLGVYPKLFRHSELGMLDDFHGKLASPLGGRLPQLAKIKLEDLFEMKQPGDYVLTIWPKIYRQLKNDDDLCERIDVSPVSLKIKWERPPDGPGEK